MSEFHEEHIPFSRSNATSKNNADVELRGMAPRDLIDVVDAVGLARNKSRIDLVVEVMQEWADKRVHEASLINRVLRGNPLGTDASGVDSRDVGRGAQ